MVIKAMTDIIILSTREDREEVRTGNLITVNSIHRNLNEGVVMSIGSKCQHIKVGDIILTTHQNQSVWYVNGLEVKVMKIDNIIATLSNLLISSNE